MADWPAVRRISAKIWEGHDYVPLFFKQWVREGGFWGAGVRGRLAGYGKATELAPGEWWLEGLRVDPALRGRGIGAELSRSILYHTFDRRPTTLRLATAEVNRESVRIIEETMHFRRFAQFRGFLTAPADVPEGELLVVPAAREALRFIGDHGEFAASKGLLQSTWRFREANARLLSESKRAGRLFGYRRQGKLDGVLVCGPHRYRAADLDVSFIGGSDRALAAFKAYLHRRARAAGGKTIGGMAASGEMSAAFEAIGASLHARHRAVLVFDYPI